MVIFLCIICALSLFILIKVRIFKHVSLFESGSISIPTQVTEMEPPNIAIAGNYGHNSHAIINKDQRIIQVNRTNWINAQYERTLSAPSVLDLMKEKEIKDIRYIDLLNCFEWYAKRIMIGMRDGFTCKDCGNRSYYYHIHHTYYLKDRLPWEYEDSALVTLCRTCHRNRHDKESIPVYIQIDKRKFEAPNSNYFYCHRCNNSGYLPRYHYYQNGICFSCYGNFIDTTIFSKRLKDILHNTDSYDINTILNNFSNRIESISCLEFESKIFIQDEIITNSGYNCIDDLPFGDSCIDNFPF